MKSLVHSRAIIRIRRNVPKQLLKRYLQFNSLIIYDTVSGIEQFLEILCFYKGRDLPILCYKNLDWHCLSVYEYLLNNVFDFWINLKIQPLQNWKDILMPFTAKSQIQYLLFYFLVFKIKAAYIYICMYVFQLG